MASDDLFYDYTEESMSPFDDLNLPGRTTLLSEASADKIEPNHHGV